MLFEFKESLRWMPVINCPHNGVKEQACGALWSLAGISDNVDLIVKCGAIPKLVECLGQSFQFQSHDLRTPPPIGRLEGFRIVVDAISGNADPPATKKISPHQPDWVCLDAAWIPEQRSSLALGLARVPGQPYSKPL